MKKLLCAVLLGALTLAPSFSGNIGNETVQIEYVFSHYEYITPYSGKCHYNVLNAKTGELRGTVHYNRVYPAIECRAKY